MKFILICLLCGASMVWLYATIALIFVRDDYWPLPKRLLHLFLGASLLAAAFLALVYLGSIIETMP